MTARLDTGPAGPCPTDPCQPDPRQPDLSESSSSGAWLLAHFKGLYHVAELDVAVANSDTALEALPDLGGVILEPAQRIDGEVIGDHDAISDQASLGVPGDRARPHDRTE